MPNTDRLTRAYLDSQIARSLNAARNIGQRSNVTTGRIAPADGDLPIHGGRRIDATVMFVDICKFSSRPSWTAADQENLLRVLSLFFTEMIRIVQDYGGTVEKNTGDGLMAYFTRQPSSDATPQKQAVAAALTMFHAATHIINPIIRASNLDPMDFRICLDHGPITVAQVGAARGFNGIVAIGTTANIACKMLSVAENNTLLVWTKVLEGLPAEWVRSYVSFKTDDTGWFFVNNGTPYIFWQYDGRWTEPTS